MILDGKKIAKVVRDEVAAGVRELAARGRVPGLTVVRVGDDPASAVYVRSKRKASEEVGIRAVEIALPASTSQDALLGRIRDLNADRAVHAILVQLPLPSGIDSSRILDAIDPGKDVDGFHPVNVGALVQGRPGPRPCTPAGIMRLLSEAGCNPAGKRAVVIGRSNIVGKPMALMLLERNATVTMAHSRTVDLAAEVARADIVVAAVGRAELVRGDWIRQGAVVIDVGMNRRADGSLVGDVAFEEASKRASAITPVPGGVGPMTVAMLVSNTLDLARAVS